MCVPQKKGNLVCACSCTPEIGSVETFCSCADMKTSMERRLTAIEKKLEQRQ
jgi:hypothetical protein